MSLASGGDSPQTPICQFNFFPISLHKFSTNSNNDCMEAFLFRNIPFDNLEGELGYFCPKNMFLQMLPFYLLSLPRPPQLLQIVSIILYLNYHHQHHIDVYVLSPYLSLYHI